MDWDQVCNDPALKDLPYKIELNEPIRRLDEARAARDMDLAWRPVEP